MVYYANSNELYHHGVKGMKWGVRRYQNYDGTYTKRGLERYNKAEESYNSASKRYSDARSAYKSGTGSKAAVKSAKKEVKTAKRNLDKSYDQLKLDKRADKGKELYKRGNTIEGNKTKVAIGGTAISIGSYAASLVLKSSIANESVANVSSAIVNIGGAAASTALATRMAIKNQQLRAYYAH